LILLTINYVTYLAERLPARLLTCEVPTMTTVFGLDAIGQIHISVADLPRAVAFYRDVLGMKLLFEVPGQPMAFFDCGGIRLYLGKPDRPEFASHPLIYYRVASIADAVATLKARGVAFTEEPRVVHRTPQMELWLAGFRDPDGNYVSLMSEVAKAA
jgi:catechol 2,3-dioxygenase-like lactoylglutathione lyase family enzyme